MRSLLKIAITGANGFIGQYIASEAISRGHAVTCYGRKDPGLASAQHISWSLGEEIELTGQNILIHAAFQHAPGRYRGGEGDDPAAFLKSNLEGTLRLFQTAKSAGVSACIFLSTRAIFDGYPPGTLLTEDLRPLPTTLYGNVKAEAEKALAALSSPQFLTASIRPTGVFGIPLDGSPHKWSTIFADFRAGRNIEPRIATEVHAADLAVAVLLVCSDMMNMVRRNQAENASNDLSVSGWHKSEAVPSIAIAIGKALSSGMPPQRSQDIESAANSNTIDTGITNPKDHKSSQKPAARSAKIYRNVHLSDLILDRQDLLRLYTEIHGLMSENLPPHRSSQNPCILDCKAALQLGWKPSGFIRLREMLRLI